LKLICRVISFDLGDQSDEGIIEILEDGPGAARYLHQFPYIPSKDLPTNFEKINSESITVWGFSRGYILHNTLYFF
jgi:hypothetical protein